MTGQRGAALIWVAGVLAISLLSLFTLAGWLVAIQAAARRDIGRADARLLARNAVHVALAELNRNTAYAGATTPEVQLTVTRPAAAAPEASPWHSLDATDDADWRFLAAVATLGSARATAGGTAKAIYHPAFPAGLFATDSLDLRDVTTDSYDSRRGDYRARRDFTHGDLGTFGELRLTGEGRVGGNARPGPGKELVAGAGVAVLGRKTPYPERYRPQPLEGERQDLLPLRVPMGKTTTIGGGAYIADNFMLADTTRLLLQGTVVIYVPGAARIPANGLILQHQKSSELTIYVAGGEVDIYPPFVGALHAPKAAVRIHGQGEIFGAVTGKTIANDGKLAVHFDRALPYLTRGTRVEFRLMGWAATAASP